MQQTKQIQQELCHNICWVIFSFSFFSEKLGSQPIWKARFHGYTGLEDCWINIIQKTFVSGFNLQPHW